MVVNINVSIEPKDVRTIKSSNIPYLCQLTSYQTNRVQRLPWRARISWGREIGQNYVWSSYTKHNTCQTKVLLLVINGDKIWMYKFSFGDEWFKLFLHSSY